MRKFISFLVVAVMMATMMPFTQLTAVAADGQTLFINEIMAANTITLRDGDVDDPESGTKGGAYSDWIEIYNGSTQQIDLTGYTISDDGATWTIPQGIISANGYLLVWASDKNKVATDGQFHSNFKLSSSGETVTLKNSDGNVVDAVKFPVLSDDQSYGRKTDGASEVTIFTKSTPLSSNAEGTAGAIQPLFSKKAGFYTQAFSLQITNSDPDSKVYYTTDGSDPVVGALGTNLYIGAINIKSRTGEANVLSNIPLLGSFFTPWTAPKGEVFKCTTIKAATVKTDGTKSKIVTNTYFVDPNMKTKYSLPVISIVTDQANFFDNTKGIYVGNNYNNTGKDWERPMHIEYFEKDGTLGFSQYCGVRIDGGYSTNNPQKSLRLYADAAYDDVDKFKYDIFPNLTKTVSSDRIKSFGKLVLGNSGSDWQLTMMRDAAVQSLLTNLNVDTQAYKPSVVFLDGEYWGIHNIRERYDNKYFEDHYNLNKDNVIILKIATYNTNTVEVDEGKKSDSTLYDNDITQYLKSNSITQQGTYDYIKTKMDIDNFIDYQITNIFSANIDWPSNNVSIWKYRTTDGQYHAEAPYGQDGRWRWLIRDTDSTFGFTGTDATHNTLSTATTASSENTDWAVFLLKTLLQNPEFRSQFISRFADLMNTTFDSTRVNNKIDEIKNIIATSIPEQSDRWQAITDWTSNVQAMKIFANNRAQNVRQHIQSYFSSDGVTGTSSITLNTDVNKGYLKINSVDIKASTPGVTTPAAWTGIYFKGVPVTLKALPETGYKFDHWEGITGVTQSSDAITFTPSSDANITAVFTTIEPTGFKVSGYINPNFTSAAPNIKAGFKVEIVGGTLSAVTDSSGYFEMTGVPSSTTGYTLKISKTNYLYREINNVVVTADKVLADQAAPLVMWAGDMLINGEQDNAINMADIMDIVKSFNSSAGEVRYKKDRDFNADNAINMSDIMIVVMNYNTIPSNY